MDYKFLFLVGSAINHFQEKDFSRFNSDERFNQTLKTIQSIKERVPDAYILVYEASENPISSQYKKKLEKNCDALIECGDDIIMKNLYENLHRDPQKFVFVKSMLECRCLQIVLNYMKQTNIFNDASRVFKLSGRYLLNDDFNIDDYKSQFLINKYVMKYYDYKERFFDPENVYGYLYGCKGSVVTGLWSFDRLLFLDIMEVLSKSLQYMEKAIQFTAGVDIEHSFYHFLDRDKILNIPNLGLTVIKGMEEARYNI